MKNFIYWTCVTIALIALAVSITVKVMQWNVVHKPQFRLNGDMLTVTVLGQSNTYDLSTIE